MKYRIYFFLVSAAIIKLLPVAAQDIQVYPTHWFVGMKMNRVQIILHETRADYILSVNKLLVRSSSPDLVIKKIHTPANRRYLILDTEIKPTAKPQTVQISFGGIVPNEWRTVPFEIKPRRKGRGETFAQGLTAADLVYLIMPDRFSNGDERNDRIPGMLDQTLRRDTVFNRHGGDLKGIQNHLGYLHDLGVTALWLNPVLENDMPNRTEHGYAFTDHYRIDRRIGGEKAYKELVAACHEKGIKMIQDAVYNHCGSEHVLYKDMPDSSWFNWWPKYTNTTYKDQAIFDPYASAIDRKQMSDGWFVPSMPDWNHRNIFVENFLIQHAVFTVEEFGIDAYRIDTYAYNDLPFMNRCNQALLNEYPRLFMFGETWVHGVPNQGYFTENNYNIPFKSNLPGVTDFQTLWGIKDALKVDFGWTDGVNKLYTILAQDFAYKNPMNNVTFLDNHDINRFYSELGEDVGKYKMALGWLLTCRGIPQLYYGGEILMTGLTSPNDGYVRRDFPGGWAGDTANKFEASGRNEKENEVFNFIKKLANYRKKSAALGRGEMIQYVPVDAVYAYFRKYKNERVMVIMNTAKENRTVSFNRFVGETKGFSNYMNLVTGETASLATTVTMPPYSIIIAELK
jgi:neopullulanase